MYANARTRTRFYYTESGISFVPIDSDFTNEVFNISPFRSVSSVHYWESLPHATSTTQTHSHTLTHTRARAKHVIIFFIKSRIFYVSRIRHFANAVFEFRLLDPLGAFRILWPTFTYLRRIKDHLMKKMK